jgi:hypothetical protein
MARLIRALRLWLASRLCPIQAEKPEAFYFDASRDDAWPDERWTLTEPLFADKEPAPRQR